jgi:hypothetical protein
MSEHQAPLALITVGAFLAGFKLAIFCDYYANRRRPYVPGINGFRVFGVWGYLPHAGN